MTNTLLEYKILILIILYIISFLFTLNTYRWLNSKKETYDKEFDLTDSILISLVPVVNIIIVVTEYFHWEVTRPNSGIFTLKDSIKSWFYR